MTVFGGFRSLWIIVFFDLPTDTKQARKSYTLFRKKLLKDGYIMLQYSVYARHCASEENLDVHRSRIVDVLPPDGEVRIVKFTDKQFERMEIFHGKRRKATEKAPKQISFF